jgi:NitT/TauT family transport system substrate-binding protein
VEKNFKIAAVLGFAAVFLIMLIAVGNPTGFVTAKTEKVRIADIPITQSAPLYYALEKGLFEDQGIGVEIIRFDSPKQIVDAVALNQVDLGGPGSATGISAIAE